MTIIDLATKAMQEKIKSVVDTTKTVVDGIKTTVISTETTVNGVKSKTDTLDTRTNTMNTNINNINTNVGTVKTDVASIKNTVTSGFKPAVMTPFSYVITKGSGSYTIDTWYTLINITGEGELQNVLSAVGHGNGSNMLRVTIDGVVKYYGKTPESYNGPGGVIGMTKLDNIFNRPDYGEPFMGLSATNDFNLGSVVTYPYTGGGGGVSLIDIPIRFKSSLKIEWMPQVRTTDTHYVFATGGVF